MAEKSNFSRIVLIIVGLLTIAIANGLYEFYKTPPFLRLATAGGGWWSGCDDSDSPDVKKMGYAISPDLQKRLELAFPPGTPEVSVIKMLNSQGFKKVGEKTCETNRNIHGARYDDGSIWSSIIWKIDAQKNILWIRGSIAFHSL